MAVVSGRLQLRDWNDRDGNKCRSAEIVTDNVYFGDSKKEQEPPEVAHGAADGFPGGGFPGSNLPNGFDPFAVAEDDGELSF